MNNFKTNKRVVVSEALEGLPQLISNNWLDYESSWQKIEPERFGSYAKAINRLEEGVGDPIAIKRFDHEREVSGCFGTNHTKTTIDRFKKLKPGEQDAISKSKKLDGNGYCPTLRAGTDNKNGSYQAVRPIHYIHPRVITPREAARLQGFPDWFQFHETKWHSFRQIGNSVCPIVGQKVLSTIKSSLNM